MVNSLAVNVVRSLNVDEVRLYGKTIVALADALEEIQLGINIHQLQTFIDEPVTSLLIRAVRKVSADLSKGDKWPEPYLWLKALGAFTLPLRLVTEKLKEESGGVGLAGYSDIECRRFSEIHKYLMLY